MGTLSQEVRTDVLCGRICDLEAENAKLVDVLHEVEAEAVHAYHCLQQDCVTTANSSQHFFDKWWHAECELDRLKTENAKLRELCKSMRCALVGHDDKVYLAALDDTLVDAGFDLQKLGIEVDG